MQDHPDLTRDWRILYKPRGNSIEHTAPQDRTRHHRGRALLRANWTNGLGLGDTDFDMPDWAVDTRGPRHRYGAVLAVEKGGIADVLRHAEIGERRDVAIIGNEGQSVEAELVLADALGDVAVPIFLLTDCDRRGSTSPRTCARDAWRHRCQVPSE